MFWYTSTQHIQSLSQVKALKVPIFCSQFLLVGPFQIDLHIKRLHMNFSSVRLIMGEDEQCSMCGWQGSCLTQSKSAVRMDDSG